MALDISENLKQDLKNSKITPVLVLQIEGYDKVFNNTLIKTFIKIGDPGLKIGEPIPPELAVWTIGGFKTIEEQSPFINFNIGTTTKITQKLDPSRGLGSSVSQMNIVMVDSNEEITTFIAPGIILSELLGRRVTVSLGLNSSSFPEDYNIVFRGNIQDIESGAGFVSFALNNTEERKRQTILAPVTAKTLGRIQYRSLTYGSLFFQNIKNLTDLVTIDFQPGGTAGSEIVSVIGNDITIVIQDDVSTAGQVKKALEENDDVKQLITIELAGDKDDTVDESGIPRELGESIGVEVDDATGFLSATSLPVEDAILAPYLRVGDEIFGYGQAEDVTNIIQDFYGRGSYGSTPESYEIDTEVEQLVRLRGNAIDLILQLFLSTGPQFYVETLAVESVGSYLDSSIDNAIFFSSIDVESVYGVTVGDTLTSIGSAIPGNNVTDSIIVGVGRVPNGSYIILSDTLTNEDPSDMTVSLKSQFNVLPIGVGLLPSEVDVKQHLFVRDTFLSTVSFDLITESIPNGKEFIETQLYLPISCFSVPRKGRSSIVYQVPPIATEEVITLDLNNVVNPEKLRIRRSLAENFFNQIIFEYDYNPATEKFNTVATFNSVDSQSRIPVGFKPFRLSSRSLRSEDGAGVLVASTANRLLRRYQFGAEYIKGIRLLYGRGYQVEIGDPVIVDFTALQLSDSKTGTRQGDLRLMEVLNKTLDAKTGEITIDVVDTTFGVNDRLGLISPSSNTDIGSSNTKLILKKSFGTQSFDRESTKWLIGGYVGQEITVRNEDFTQSFDTVIRGFDNNDPQGMLVDFIPTIPGEDWVIENPRYPDSTNANDLAFWKFRHAYLSPQVAVVNAITLGQDQFEVDGADIAKFFVGSVVKVHNYTYTDDGTERTVIDVNPGTNVITLNGDVGFDIDNTHFVDLIGFPDQGAAYRII